MGYDEIVAARDRLTRLHEQTPLRPPKTGWAGSRTAAQLHYATLPDLILLRKNLMRRVNTAMSRHQTLDSRPELARFINLVDAEIARRNSHHVS